MHKSLSYGIKLHFSVLTPAFLAILWTGDIFRIDFILIRVVSSEKVARVVLHVVSPVLTPSVLLGIFRVYATYSQVNEANMHAQSSNHRLA